MALALRFVAVAVLLAVELQVQNPSVHVHRYCDEIPLVMRARECELSQPEC